MTIRILTENFLILEGSIGKKNNWLILVHKDILYRITLNHDSLRGVLKSGENKKTLKKQQCFKWKIVGIIMLLLIHSVRVLNSCSSWPFVSRFMNPVFSQNSVNSYSVHWCDMKVIRDLYLSEPFPWISQEIKLFCKSFRGKH